MRLPRLPELPSADRLIAGSTVAAVVAVAGVVGYISYEHAVAVVRWAGETGAIAWLYPVTVDGLIYAASMVLLDAARRGERAHLLARVMLGAGIAATLAANVIAGQPYTNNLHGWTRLVVFGWPAPVVVGMYELLMVLVRRRVAAAEAVAEAGLDPDPAPPMRQQRRPVKQATPRPPRRPTLVGVNGGGPST